MSGVPWGCRASLAVQVAALLGATSVGCSDAQTQTPSEADAGARMATVLRVVEANVGNLDEATGGPCPAAPYHGTPCSMGAERALAAGLAQLNADVVVLLEVLDADLCPPSSWDGGPDLACSGAPFRSPYQQVERLVGPGYVATCDGLGHYDCVAVRADAVRINECDGGTCMGASFTPPQPDACQGVGSISSVSSVHAVVDGRELTVVVAHPLNATSLQTDPCRLAQLEQALEQLPGPGAALIAGDMNIDPYRLWEVFPSANRWHDFVGQGRRFTAHNLDADPPTPTWGTFATLDYVLTDEMQGSCVVLGNSPGTAPLEGMPTFTDHRALSCTLSWPR